MTQLIRFAAHDLWLDQIFSSKSRIVRRSIASVDREIGRDALELEVRRRGFHMIEASGQLIIICDPGPVRMIC